MPSSFTISSLARDSIRICDPDLPSACAGDGGRVRTGLPGAGVFTPEGAGVKGKGSLDVSARVKYTVNPFALPANLLAKFWNVWKSPGAKRDQLTSLLRSRIDAANKTKIFSESSPTAVIESTKEANSSEGISAPRTLQC